MSENEESMVVHLPEPYVTTRLPGVLLVREVEVQAKSMRSPIDKLLDHMGDRRVSIVIATLEPPADTEPTADDNVGLLRTSFGATKEESMEEAARRVVLDYLTRRGQLPAVHDFVVEAAMLVCRPGPSWSVKEASDVLRRGDAR